MSRTVPRTVPRWQVTARRAPPSRLAQRVERIERGGALGRQVDFVSRFFAPRVGVPEDPVTGSAHTKLTPYWSARLGKPLLSAMQLSKRQGQLRCRMAGDRVEIAGRAGPYLQGTISI